jgi:hypothetical protein
MGNLNVAKIAHRVAGIAILGMPLVFALGYFQFSLPGQSYNDRFFMYAMSFMAALFVAHIAVGVTGSNLGSTFVQDGVMSLLRFPAGVIGRWFSHRGQLKELALMADPKAWDKTKIFPRLKHSDFLTALTKLVGVLGDQARGQTPVTKVFCGDILVTYSLDLGDKYHSINLQNLREMNLTAQQLHDLSIENLRRATKDKIGFFRTKTFIALHCKIDTLTAASLLLPEVCQEAEKYAGAQGLRFMVPRPDMIAFVGPNQVGKIDGQELDAEQCFVSMVFAAREAATDAKQMAISFNPVQYVDGVWSEVALPTEKSTK